MLGRRRRDEQQGQRSAYTDGPGGDEHPIQTPAREHATCERPEQQAAHGRDLEEAERPAHLLARSEIRDQCQLGAGDVTVQGDGVIGAHDAGADHADADAHGIRW